MNDKAKRYGDSVIAAMGAVTRIISVGSLMVFGFIKGFQPIAGYSYGSKKYDRLQQAIKISIIWSTIFCVIFGVTIAIFSTSLVSQFTKVDIEMINVGKEWNIVCSAGSRYPFRNNYHLYGSTASPGISFR